MRMQRILPLVGLSVLLGACASAQNTAEGVLDEAQGEIDPGPTAQAVLRDAQGQVVGNAVLEEEGDEVEIELEVQGMPPGLHGFHIHETGTCTPPDFTSAGGHYNPTDMEHGFEDPDGPHAGDMQNIEVPPSGAAGFEIDNDRVTLSPGPRTLFDADGSALVVHAGPDDYVTDPSGNSGARIACGVIERS